jgi:hypothetical protein
MNWSVDWSWWAKDAGKKTLSDRLQAFFEAKGCPITATGSRLTAIDGQGPLDRSGGHERRGQPGRHQSTRHGNLSKALWNLPIPDGTMALLRRHVVSDGLAALRRRVPHLVSTLKIAPRLLRPAASQPPPSYGQVTR